MVGKPFRLVVPALALALVLSACGLYSSARQDAGLPSTPATGTQAPLPQSPVPATPVATPLASPPVVNLSPPATVQPAGVDLSAYRGLATWVDVYDQSNVFGPRAFGDPARSVQTMVSEGVRTVFLEAGSYRHPPVSFPAATARFIRAAHAAGLKVVAWYLPLFRSVRKDFAEVMRVLRFQTSDGQHYDGFALDIEADLVPPAPRIANMLRLSAEIRAAAGPSYALGAIIPSPRGLIRVPTYWPGFPYAMLPRFYDVILPMSYFTFHYHGAAVVDRYIRDNVEIIRRDTGDPGVPVHVIGGIAGDMSPAEAAAFVRAARSEHVFGASLYEFAGTTVSEWRTLSPIR